MVQFQIVVNTLKITDGINTVFSISKKDVYYIQTSLNAEIPKISLYNLNVGVFSIVFETLLSNALDPNGDPFTVNSFTDFAEINLGFNTGGASSSITVTNSYATLPDPTTVVGEFYWCENADGTFPVGLYYSDGLSWQFQVADDITVVANYSALPNPTTVSGQFFWAEASQGTSWLPANVGGTYYSAGMYYSNGTSWSFLDVPYQATQAEVNTGTNTNKFVTPSTLKNQNYLAPLASPALTGTPTAPTQTANDNSTKIATTAYVDTKVTNNIKIWKSGNNGATVANTLTITPTYTQLIPANTFQADDVVEILFRSTTTTAKTSISSNYVYINTTNDLTGTPLQIALYSGLATSRIIQLQRTLSIKGATTRYISGSASAPTDTNVFVGLMTSSNIDWTINQYFIFAIGHTVADQTLIGDCFRIQKD